MTVQEQAPSAGAARLVRPPLWEVPGLLSLAVRDPLRSLAVMAHRYGDTAAVPIGPGRDFFLFTRPEHVDHILVARSRRYATAFTYRPLRAWVGLGLITSDGELWERQHRLIQPMFAHKRVVLLAPHMSAATQRMLDRWDRLPDGTELAVTKEMSSLTLDIVGQALFGADLTEYSTRIAQSVTVLQDAASTVAKNPLTWVSFPLAAATSPGLRHWAKAMRVLDGVLAETISKRRAERWDGPPRDLLDALVSARDETGAPIDDRQIRDELITFFMAGHETSANCLGWTFYLLATSPHERELLVREVDEVLDGRTPTLDDLDHMVRTKAVLAESMRLYPPVWTIERDCIEDDDVGGIRVPAGSSVAIPPYLVHRHPEHWPNPEGFQPGRFAPEQAAGRPKYAHIPFGAGRRRCVGNVFAMMELVTALSMITQRCRLDLVPGTAPTPKATVTLRPDNLRMTLHRR